MTNLNKVFTSNGLNIRATSDYNTVKVEKRVKDLIVASATKVAVFSKTLRIIMTYRTRDRTTLVFNTNASYFSSDINIYPTFRHHHLSGNRLCIGRTGYSLIRKRVDITNLEKAARILASNFEPVEAVLATPEMSINFNSDKYKKLPSLQPQPQGRTVKPFMWNGTPWYHLKKPALREIEDKMAQAIAQKGTLTVDGVKDSIVASWSSQYPGLDVRTLPDWLFTRIMARHNLMVAARRRPTPTTSRATTVTRQNGHRIVLENVNYRDLFIAITN